MDFQGIIDWVSDRLKGPEPVTHMVNGQAYAIKADGTLGEPVRNLLPQFDKPTLQVGTLGGLVSAFNAKLDEFPDEVAFHVTSPTSVALISTKADDFGRRHVWVNAKHQIECPFRFGVYMNTEDFLIAFRASFFYNDNAVNIQKLLSSLTAENSVSVADDGISQVVTAKSGAVTREAVELPPEIPLIPWRTFREANPVTSRFMLRLKGVKDGVPQAALFEIDAKWQLDTVNSIANYLTASLPDVKVIT